MDLAFVQVTEESCEFLWKWANDPETRANSFDSSTISLEQHKKWFLEKIQDPRCCFWMATNRELGKIGVVRFECDGKKATISIALAPHARGKGYGKKLIKSACHQIFASSGVDLILALIKPTHKRSIRAFEGAGFLRGAATEVTGQPAEQYLLQRTFQ